jgi:hypothetical protein
VPGAGVPVPCRAPGDGVPPQAARAATAAHAAASRVISRVPMPSACAGPGGPERSEGPLSGVDGHRNRTFGPPQGTLGALAAEPPKTDCVAWSAVTPGADGGMRNEPGPRRACRACRAARRRHGGPAQLAARRRAGSGPGRIVLAAFASRAGTAWTDHGTARRERGLKHRAAHETRTIPIPPELVKLFRAHVKRYGITARGGILQDSACNEVWAEARKKALTEAQCRSPLGRPYDLRHAAVSQWLNSGVPATEVARRAGHRAAVLLKIYAHCIDGQAGAANQRITDAPASPRQTRTPEAKATPTMSRQPEMAGQRQEAGQDGRHYRSRPRRPGCVRCSAAKPLYLHSPAASPEPGGSRFRSRGKGTGRPDNT